MSARRALGLALTATATATTVAITRVDAQPSLPDELELVSVYDPAAADETLSDAAPSISADGLVVAYRQIAPHESEDETRATPGMIRVRERRRMPDVGGAMRFEGPRLLPIPVPSDEPGQRFGPPVINQAAGPADGCIAAFVGVPSGSRIYRWNRCASQRVPNVVLASDVGGNEPIYNIDDEIAIAGDGERIAFSASDSDWSRPNAYRLDLQPGGARWEMPPVIANGRAWSPDNVHSVDISGDGAVVTASVDFVEHDPLFHLGPAPVTLGTATELTNLTPGWHAVVRWDVETSSVELAHLPLPDAYLGTPAVSETGRFVAFGLASSVVPRAADQGAVWDSEQQTTTLIPPPILRPRVNGPATNLASVPLLRVVDVDMTSDGSQVALAYELERVGTALYLATSRAGSFDTRTRPVTHTVDDVLASMANDRVQLQAGDPSISASGGATAFSTNASNLLLGDPSGAMTTEVWVKVREAALTSPPTIDFGTVRVATTTPPRSVVIENTSTVSVTVDGVIVTGPFAVVSDACTGVSLTPGWTCAVEVVFQPSSTGSLDGALTVRGGDVETVTTLTGTVEVPPTGDLVINPQSIDFGLVDVGSSSSPQTATIRNTTGTSIALSAISGPAAPFALTADGCSGTVLADGASCTVDVTFRPAVGGRGASQLAATAGAATATVDLIGEGRVTSVEPAGLLAIEPTSLDFGAALIDTAIAGRALRVTNTGGSTLDVDMVLDGAGKTAFRIERDGCSSPDLSAGASCEVVVAPVVDVPGNHAASLAARVVGGPEATAALRVEVLHSPRLVMNPGVARPGEVTFAVGTGFPPNIDVELAIDGEAPFATVQTDDSGSFRWSLLLVRNASVGGPLRIIVVDQREFTGVFAPLLVTAASFQPSGSGGVTMPMGTRLVARNG